MEKSMQHPFFPTGIHSLQTGEKSTTMYKCRQLLKTETIPMVTETFVFRFHWTTEY